MPSFATPTPPKGAASALFAFDHSCVREILSRAKLEKQTVPFIHYYRYVDSHTITLTL